MLYEMRAYRVADGRMEEEIARALGTILDPSEGGLGMFARYGIPKPTGIWRVLSGPALPSVIFLYPWKSAHDRSRAFEAFGQDAEWLRYRKSTNAGTEIVDRMDDLLLTGPKPGRLPLDALYEFTWDEPPGGASVAIGPLVPLCGSRTGPLYVLRHDKAGPIPALVDERTLCRLVALRAAA